MQIRWQHQVHIQVFIHPFDSIVLGAMMFFHSIYIFVSCRLLHANYVLSLCVSPSATTIFLQCRCNLLRAV